MKVYNEIPDYRNAVKTFFCVLAMWCTLSISAGNRLISGRISEVDFRWINERELALSFKSPYTVDLKSSYSLRIEPVFRENNEEVLSFPSLLYFTRKGKRFFDRRQSYQSTAEQMEIHDILVKDVEYEDSLYTYTDTLRIGGGYDKSGEILLKCWITDCCSKVLADSLKAGVVTLAVNEPVVAEKVEPHYETTDISLYVNYPWDESVIYPEYMDNEARLSEFASKAGDIIGDTVSYRVNRILIKGYASPEGGYMYNMDLSRRRAEAFAGYLADNFGADSETVHITGKGENWEGLYEAVEKDPLVPYREEVMNLLKPYGSDAVVPCERELKRLHGGEAYRYLLKKIYPRLRKMTMTIYYIKK